MSHVNEFSLDGIVFENVSYHVVGRDPILEHVDFDFPLDQNVLVKSTWPDQAVLLLEMLAGRREPESGRILLNGEDWLQTSWTMHEVVGTFFEKERPLLNLKLKDFWKMKDVSDDAIKDAIEFFEVSRNQLNSPMKDWTFAQQKWAQLVYATLHKPQMLVLEDPASGLSESEFLDYLDWINYGQRAGGFRHLFLTNNHPTAMRHIPASVLYLEDGLLYLDELEPTKKAVHF